VFFFQEEKLAREPRGKPLEQGESQQQTKGKHAINLGQIG